MFDFYYLIVILVSFGAAFFSGLLGIGGGIIIFPSFLYLMPHFGYTSYTVNEITGIAAVQSLIGVFFAYLNHLRSGNIRISLVKAVLPVGLAGGLLGSMSAKFFSEKNLLIIYLVLLVIAMTITLIPKNEYEENCECQIDRPFVTNSLIFFGTAISGALGFAGAVTFIPILNHFCNTPIKIAISTTTLIVVITTAMVFVGKASVGLVPFNLIIFMIIGSIFGANVGARLNGILKPSTLRYILILVILTLGIRILFSIFEY